MSYTYIFKFIIIGDTGVGKSCLLLKYIDGRFKQKHQVTIGVQFGAKVINVQNNNIKLQIWDTAGQQSFKSITRGYYRSAAVALLVYDITNRDSFQNVLKWLQQVRSNGNSTLSFALIGNKSDLDSDRAVSYQQGQKMAQQNGMIFFQSSSKQGDNVKQAFQQSSLLVLQKIDRQQIDPYNPNSGVKFGNMHRTGKIKLQQGLIQKQSNCRC